MVQLAAQPPRRVDLENLAIAVIQTKGIAWAPKRYRARMTSSAVSLLHISDRFWTSLSPCVRSTTGRTVPCSISAVRYALDG
jgi:hypothetical protein